MGILSRFTLLGPQIIYGLQKMELRCRPLVVSSGTPVLPFKH
ncbi:unnamed protein product, partial [Vitis vinifera]